MELHTLGVEGGYTQKDVTEVARAFTGWTIANPRGGGGFRFEPRLHDDGAKMVLGHSVKAGGGIRDGEQVLDILARHPSTARFISTKLARRFVSDVPPAGLVDRLAARFTDTHGDLRAVMTLLLASPEFLAPASYRAKVKTPFEFVVSAVRATGAQFADTRMLVKAVQDLGMPLYQCQPPTGYKDTADAWTNTGALVNRMNFALAISGATAGRGRPGQVRGAARARSVRHDARDNRQSDSARAGAGARAGLAGISASLDGRRSPRYEREAMVSRRVFLKNGAFALVSLGFAPSFLARTAFAAGDPRRARQLIAIFQRGAVMA